MTLPAPDAPAAAGPLARWRDERIRHMLRYSPHNPVTGLARTLMALGSAMSIAATPVEQLFLVTPARPEGRICDGLAGAVGLFCVVPAGWLEPARWACVAVLLLVAAGWRPRLTALPHWWVAFSFCSATSVVDGGDQVAADVALGLLPVLLTDPRRWHWQSAPAPQAVSPAARVAAHLGLVLVWVQVCVVYLQSSVAKLDVPEWRDGSAVWYWAMHPPFGVPDHLREPAGWVLAGGPAVLGATWGTLAVEFLLAWCLFAHHSWRRIALPLGVGLHAAIAVVLGLPGFSLIMVAAVVLYLVRPGDPVPRWPRRSRPRTGGGGGVPRAADPPGSAAGAPAPR
ncbi:sporulation-delaying protein SdpB family protein [Marinitenerispora sediminis]|uniref:HTTM-like domain-containing protein n=1 Tax=Marinitenerispora sediminis TaxID=1931232 RepID=A0A368T1H6_9ACTN|nr:sporulation-delaying protein SdpB family protein [Marinitenerispora sediminis]RCV50935.1 hypothetical protein DEF23_21285 [Marinitenerispora sediminis]RCV51615.1 hypothetical protein DEF28_15085 [Marinitenerispora sediminis]RCV54268.1 hypothetical protein DEF24_19455 [Marinitenerispora sediminis]